VIVANRLTPLDAREAGRALFSAYTTFTGRPPSDRVGALLLAQSALETGNWQKIHNYNFGNAKARPEYPTITQFRCSEVIDGVERFFDPPDPQCNFRAYATASEGALDYLKVLHSQSHWWQGLQTGDPSAFVDGLATPPKYFTADPPKYKRALTALFEQFHPLVTALLGRPVPRGAPAVVLASAASSSVRPSSLEPSTTGRGGESDQPVRADQQANSAPPSAPSPQNPASNESNGPRATSVTTSPVPKTIRSAIQVVEDAANAIVVAANAAEAITSTTTALPSSTAVGRAAAVVRVVRWVAQFINWLLAALRLRKGAPKKP
jgi:hypothetical protein